MLRVGLTGGIGSGKSTAARRLVELGAVLVDSDVLAREALAPGSDGLAEVVAGFGRDVLDADGALDRAALAAVVFGDREARERLNGIVHPRVRRRSAELLAAAPAGAVVVQDVPLLVEGGMAAEFALVVVVHAAAEVRVGRLVEQRGMPEADARARVAAQAGDDERRAAADVWLDNGGVPADLEAAVDALWRDRLVPFEKNVRQRWPVEPGLAPTAAPDEGWALAAARLAARVTRAAGDLNRGVAHVGPTAMPATADADAVGLLLGVPDEDATVAVRKALAAAGFPWHAPVEGGQRHGAADPARPVRLDVRPVTSPGWRRALLVRDCKCSVPRAHGPAADDTGAEG